MTHDDRRTTIDARRRSRFDPDRLAALEAAGWRAYYDRKWLEAFWLLVLLSREQFGFSWPDAIRGAYWVVRASIAFAPLEGNRPEVARDFLARYYRVGRRAMNARFNPEAVADLEIDYWIVHRRIVGQPDREPLVRSLQTLHAALFGISEADALPSARYRARAADIVDGITNHWSTDVEGDWRRLEAELRLAYRDAHERVQGQGG